MADVFISYAREDRDTAQRIAKALEAQQYTVWWDREILAGDQFDEVIERELDLAKSVVVLWSKNSVSSNWVRSEAAAASERNVLIPAFIEEAKLPLEFRRKQTIDLIGWQGDPESPPFESIRLAIASRLHQGAPSTPPVPSIPKESGSGSGRPGARKRYFFITATVLVLLILIGLVFLWLQRREESGSRDQKLRGMLRHAGGDQATSADPSTTKGQEGIPPPSVSVEVVPKEIQALGDFKPRFTYAYQNNSKNCKGFFLSDGANRWVEYTPGAEGCIYTVYRFQQLPSNETDAILLNDPGRGYYIKIREKAGWIDLATAADGPWSLLHKIESSNPAG
jgi:hypothetical protein